MFINSVKRYDKLFLSFFKYYKGWKTFQGFRSLNLSVPDNVWCIFTLARVISVLRLIVLNVGWYFLTKQVSNHLNNVKNVNLCEKR